MFCNKSKIFLYDFSFDIEELITPIYNLLIEITGLKSIEDNFYEISKTIFDNQVLDKFQPIPKDISEDEYLRVLGSYLKQKFMDSYSLLDNTKLDVLCFDKKIILTSLNDTGDVRKILTSWLINFNLINSLFDIIVYSDLLPLRKRIASLVGREMYRKAVNVSQSRCVESYYVEKDLINTNLLTEETMDIKSMWISKQIMNQFKVASLTSFSELIDKDKSVALIADSIVLPLERLDAYVNTEKENVYTWNMLQCVYACPKNVQEKPKSVLDFVTDSKDDKLSYLLSYLHYNLYIVESEKKIEEKYKMYFDKVYQIEKLKRVDNYRFFTHVPSSFEKKDTLLGIYENEKKDSEYNLLHWINSIDSDNHLVSSSDEPKKQQSSPVFALLPNIAFYFLSRYFEDRFADILTELKANSIANANFFREGNDKVPMIEVDNLVYKNDGSIVYFENKTSLNKRNVDDTIVKMQCFHEHLIGHYKDVNIQYVIVAPYCDSSLEENFGYFVSKADKEPEQREGVNHKIFDFSIPMSKLSHHSLRCIVEPSYSLLKIKIASIIQ